MSLEVAVERRLGAFAIDAAFAAGAGITALFGRSGSGKTSIVNMIGGLLRPDRGRIAVDGQVLFDGALRVDVPAHRRRVGYVFQEGRLFPHMTVRQNLLYGRRFAPRDARHADLDHVVGMLGLEALLPRRPGALSGGEKQRVAIGRALLAGPRLLLMDEPLASLDAPRKAEIMPYIERLRDELRTPIVYVSHAVDEVTRLATTMVVLSDGKVAAVGPPSEIMGRLDLRPLTGRWEAGAVLDARVASHDPVFELTELAVPGGALRVPSLDLPVGAAVRVRLRARDVAVALGRPNGLSIRNALAGRIAELKSEEGPFAELRIDLGGAFVLARLTRLAVAELGLAPGQEVLALIKSVALDRHSVGAGAERDERDGI
jgi:molybdate transport system ATP-binding protein